jgi:cbb3-type cytochrome oxidase cytochrome c subunit
MSRRLLIEMALFFLGSTVVGAAAAPVLAQTTIHDRDPLAEQGQRIFTDQGCYGCHMVAGAGTPIGPDLSHVGAKYSESYLASWLRDPSAQKPTAHMPRISLTGFEVRALVAYLKTLK